jgi:hypothetical protein
MKIEIDWTDLVDIEVDGGTSCDAYVTAAFHKGWNRDLTETECDAVTAKYGREIYELAFDSKY